MRTNKLVIVTGLATAIALGVFTESADAQVIRKRLGNTYSPTSSDEQSVRNQFTLVDTLLDGTTISDEALSNQNTGLFVGAIEDYALANGSVSLCFSLNCTESSFNSSPRYLYDSAGFPIFETPIQTITEPFNADLLVEFFPDGEDPLFPEIGSDAIAYTIFNPETGLPVSTYRLNLLPENLLANFNQEQAINSLSYILENNLLGNADPMLYLTPGGASYTYPTDGSVTGLIFGGGDVLLQNKFEQNVSTPVPEPGTIVGTLAALATGVLLKRKKQH